MKADMSRKITGVTLAGLALACALAMPVLIYSVATCPATTQDLAWRGVLGLLVTIVGMASLYGASFMLRRGAR